MAFGDSTEVRWSVACVCGTDFVNSLPTEFLSFWREHDEHRDQAGCLHPAVQEMFRELICAECRVVLAYRIGAYPTTFP